MRGNKRNVRDGMEDMHAHRNIECCFGIEYNIILENKRFALPLPLCDPSTSSCTNHLNKGQVSPLNPPGIIFSFGFMNLWVKLLTSSLSLVSSLWMRKQPARLGPWNPLYGLLIQSLFWEIYMIRLYCYYNILYKLHIIMCINLLIISY